MIKSSLLGYNCCGAQSYLKGRFVHQNETTEKCSLNYAKRLEKPTSFVYRDPSYPLWWYGSHSAFLQQTKTTLATSKADKDTRTQYRLSFQRPDSFYSLCHHNGAKENQQDRDIAIQWNLFDYFGIIPISRPIH